MAKADNSPNDHITKRSAVLHAVRERIVSGDLPPGSRLPTRIEVERLCGANAATVQQAFDILRTDGFIESQGVRGTYVVKRPPHLARYAVVETWTGASEHELTGFQAAIRVAIPAVERDHDCRIMFYDNVGAPGTKEHDRLIADATAHRLAGAFFLSLQMVEFFQHSPLLKIARLPRVGLVAIKGVCGLGFDGPAFVTRAIDYLAARGRKRIAIINQGEFRPGTQQAIGEALARHSMTTCPAWNHNIAAHNVCNLVQLLMMVDPANRPDALFIADENLVYRASAGLLAAGVAVPKDLDVVAHASFPIQTPTPLQMKRLGWTAREFLDSFVEVAERWRSGQEPPPAIPMAPVFDDEVPAGRRGIAGAAR